MLTRPPANNHAAWLAAMAALALSGCGYRFYAGLANVRWIDRPRTDDDYAQDVVANGPQSCPSAGSAERDRLFSRYPPCETSAVPIRRVHAPAPTAPARPGPRAPRPDGDILMP